MAKNGVRAATMGHVRVEEAAAQLRGPPGICLTRGPAEEGTDSRPGSPVEPGGASCFASWTLSGATFIGLENPVPGQTLETALPCEGEDSTPPGWPNGRRRATQPLWASVSPSGNVGQG